MAQKRKSTTGTKLSSSTIGRKSRTKKTTTGRSTSKRKSSKNKVYIPVEKLMVLVSIVVLFCSVLLFASTLSISSKKEQKAQKQQIQKIIKNEEKPVSKKTEPAPKKVEPVVKQEEKNQKKNDIKPEVKPVQKPESRPEPKPEVKPEIKPETKTEVKPVVVPEVKPAPKTASDIPFIPPAQNGAKLVVIFDDGGQNLNQLEKCISLPFPVTVAVLPKLSHSAEVGRRVRQSGNELMLHQPMQAVNRNVNPGPGAITPDMGEEEIRRMLFQNVNEVGPVTGFNNHEGSLITADAQKMEAVMKFAADSGIFFLDSRTNSETKVPYVASALGYSYYERNVFLDNTKVRSDIINEIMKGVKIANQKGTAIMIGHVWSADILPSVLREMYPLLKEKGYTFTTVSKSGALKY